MSVRGLVRPWVRHAFLKNKFKSDTRMNARTHARRRAHSRTCARTHASTCTHVRKLTRTHARTHALSIPFPYLIARSACGGALRLDKDFVGGWKSRTLSVFTARLGVTGKRTGLSRRSCMSHFTHTVDRERERERKRGQRNRCDTDVTQKDKERAMGG